MNRAPRGGLKEMAKSTLRPGALGEAVRRIGALRGRSLVLVYHRVEQGSRSPAGVVPSVSSELFRRHVEALHEIGVIVPLQTLLDDRIRHARPRFALTFDDDYLTHVDQALPILRALDAPATFFLSGRALHGLGSYWFELLDELIIARGVGEVGRLLNRSGASLDALVTACEQDPVLQKIVEAEAIEAADAAHHLDRAGIEALVGAGMGVGFHTLHHRSLTQLQGEALASALTHGRDELELIVGRPLVLFAYPHGKADRRTADQVREAGYEAAWTGRPQPMHRRDDRYLLGRWEPGRVGVADLLVGTAVRLTRGGGR